MLTSPPIGGQYINIVRSGHYPWSIGTVYNSSTFAIGEAKSSESAFTNPYFAITTAGNVGIGTATPSAKLRVVGTTETDNLTLNGMMGRHLTASDYQFNYNGHTIPCYGLRWESETTNGHTFFKVATLE